MLVIAGVMKLITVDVHVARATMHRALARGAHNSSTDRADRRTYRPTDHRADDSAGHRACRSRAAGRRVLVAAIGIELIGIGFA